MVSQWCENGTITEYITKHTVNKFKLVSPCPVYLLFLCQFLTVHQLAQVASGMAYLHSCQPVVVHGDLKGVS